MTRSAGFAGARIYSQQKSLLPVFMGGTLAASSLLMQQLLLVDLARPGAMQTVGPLLVCAGACAADPPILPRIALSS